MTSAERPALLNCPANGYRFVAPVTIVTDSPPSSANRSIAVAVSAENAAGDAGREYLSDGLTERTSHHSWQPGPRTVGSPLHGADVSDALQNAAGKQVEEIAGELKWLYS